MPKGALPTLIVFSDLTRVPEGVMLARFGALAEQAKPRSVLFTVRDYSLAVRARLALLSELSALAQRTGQFFGVADRADLAQLTGAHGLHLPEHGLAERDARACLGSSVILSRACHAPERAVDVRSDMLLLSPIFAPRKGRPALGIPVLESVTRELRSASRAPAVYALGAVDAGNAALCLAAGAAGVAVIGAALAPDHTPLLRALEISRH